MASIHKRAGKLRTTYSVRYRYQSHNRQITCRTLAQARTVKNKVEHDINIGSHKEIYRVEFEEAAREWLEYVKPRIKPNTYSSYKVAAINYFVPFFKSLVVNRILPSDVSRFVTRLQNKGLKPKSVNNYLLALKQLFEYCKDFSQLKDNPAKNVKLLRVEKKEMQFLTPKQVREFLSAVNEYYYPFFLTAVLTGMRVSEIINLMWTDIDCKRGQISIIDGKTKAAKRTVFIPSKLVKILKKQKIQSKSNYVFTNKNGNKISRHDIVKEPFKRALKAAGLPNIRFHDLRHTFATLMISQGENIKFIQHQLGHGSITVTLDTYGHLLPESNMEAVERLSANVLTNQ